MYIKILWGQQKNSFKITMKLGVCKHQSENPKFKFIKINKWVYFWYFGKTFQLLIHLILVYPICLFYFIKINVLKKWFSAFLPNCSKQHSTVWSNLAFPFSALFPITIFDVFVGHRFTSLFLPAGLFCSKILPDR